MHILIIPSWYPLFKGDIGGSFFREQAIALKKSGHKVGVIYPQIRSVLDIKGIFTKPFGHRAENDNGVETFRWYSINPFPKLPELSRRYWVSCGLRLFDLYVKKYGKPNIIHVHSLLNAGYLAQLIYEKYDIPYVVTEHSSAFSRNLISEDVIYSLKSVVLHAKGCIAVSRIFSEYLEGKFPSSVWQYIPNIVNDSFFENGEEVFINQAEKKRIISICSLNKNKNTALLIKAFSQVLLQLENDAVELVIGGDGEERHNLNILVKELKLENNVKFLGTLSRNQVKEEIKKSSLFVVSSKYETFGVVAIEALALGKPVVATKCGGPESIITSDVGILVENDSVSDLAKGILHVCTHLENYDAQRLKNYCFNNFSEIKVIDKLNEIYIVHSS